MRSFYALLSLGIIALAIQQPAYGQVRINEIGIGIEFNGADEWVELYNAGSIAVQTDTMQFCNFPSYAFISNTTVLAGTTEIQPGEYLVVEWTGLDAFGGELGLYNSSFDYGSDDNILDYLEYGAAGFVRESVADSAGIWTSGDFVPMPDSGNTLAYFEFGATALEKWRQGQPTPGAANQSPVGVEDLELPDQQILSRAYPNPFTSRATVEFSLDRSASAIVRVMDTLGRVVFSSEPEVFNAGSANRIEVALDILPAGIYIYQVQASATDFKATSSGTMTRMK